MSRSLPHSNDSLTSLMRGSLLAVAVGGAVSIAIAVARPSVFWPAYLVVMTFVLGIGLGSLGIAHLNRLTGGRWGFALSREMVAAAGTVPWTALLVLPLIVGAQHLYPWLAVGESAFEINAHQEAYFAPAWWIGRGIVYALLWSGMSWMITGGYRRWCATKDQSAWHGQQRLSALGLILFWLTVTFAATDWLMSLEPEWTSTIHGAMVAMGFVVSGWAFLIAMRYHLSADPLNSDLSQDTGTMLLAFLLVWVYFSFSQFLIIWSGDLPFEINWYRARVNGIWGVFGTALLLLHFVVPFALLLSRDLKRSPRRLAWLACGLLVMRVVDLCWLILPAFESARLLWLLAVPALLAFLGGAWCWLFLGLWRRLPELPVDVLQGVTSHGPHRVMPLPTETAQEEAT